MSGRQLIVNADDLGQSPGINRGIAKAHDDGIVTSASLMVDGRAVEDAARWATAQRLSVGLHVYYGEWQLQGGSWEPLEEVVDLTDAAAVADETERQLDRFSVLMERRPTHLDSHQHA